MSPKWIMKYLRRRSKQDLINLLVISALSILLIFCEDQKVEEPYIAKVGDHELSESKLDEFLGSYKFDKKHKDEFIRQWIELELLFNEAVNKKIIQISSYKNIIEQSRREAAAALLLNDFYKSADLDIEENDIEEYFEDNIREFKLTDKAVVINSANFSNINSAAAFRRDVIKFGWDKSIGNLENNSNLISLHKDNFLYNYQLPNVKTARTIDNLLPGEISIVFESEPNVFAVVQLVNTLEENEIPSLQYIRKSVEERYLLVRKKILYKNYIENLYTKYKVEIKRETE
jgi:hypothetical protein